jgi:hypothetical protein
MAYLDSLQDKIQPLERVEKDKERLRMKAKKVQTLAAQRHNAPEPNAPALQADNMAIEADRDRVSQHVSVTFISDKSGYTSPTCSSLDLFS